MANDPSEGTYSYTQPSDGVYDVPTSEIRFLLKDVHPAMPFSLSDEELEYLLAKNTVNGVRNLMLAASQAARRMATTYSTNALKMKMVGQLKLQYDYRASSADYLALAEALLSEGSGGGSGPIYYDAGPGPFSEAQFDNNRSGGSVQTHDVFAHPLNEGPYEW